METTEIFERLKTLQDILVQKYELEKQVEEAPKQLGSQEELLSRLKKEFIVKNSEYETIKEKVLKLRFELEEAIKSREAGEKGMDNITTHREYEALEKQILEATDKENEVRKDLQKEEKALEDLKENLKMDEEMISSQEQDLANSKASLNQQLDDYKNQLQELKDEESKITPDMDQEILFKFERIIQRNSEGIVAVRNGVCTGCHMILPAQFANTVHEMENILFCPYCSRILFHEDVADGEEESYFTLKEAGSLADLDNFDGEEEEIDDETEDEDTNEYSDEDTTSLDDADDELSDEDPEEDVE